MSITTRASAPATRSTAAAILVVGYGAACYLAFLAVSLYGVAFLADVLVSRTVDHGGPHAGTATAVVIDSLLLAFFAVSHSVMARQAFKQRWTRLVPRHVERSTYVLVASGSLALAFWQWRPVPAVVWDAPAPVWPIWTLFAVGWVWVFVMSCAIDHFDLFGLRQVARHLRGRPDRPSAFALPLPYRLVRHPMMLGFFPAFLAAPTMTVGHLLFAALGCGYIIVGVRLEERDLTRELPEYAAYAAETPRLMPSLKSRS